MAPQDAAPLTVLRPSTMAWDGFVDMPGSRFWAPPAPPVPPPWWRRALGWCARTILLALGRPR